MHATFVVPIIFLAFTAVTTVLIKRRVRPAAAERPPQQGEVRAAAG
jgi:hypothetical protein